jgi:hypothetical protein
MLTKGYDHMKGVCRNLLLAVLLGCGGEQRSAALPGDTVGTTSTDTASAAPSDTSAASTRDTSTAARPESTTAAGPDTATRVAAKPAPRKPTVRKPAAPGPAAPTRPAPADTSAPDTVQQAAAPRPDSSTAPAQPAESSASPTQTSQANAPLRDPYHRAPLDTVSQQVYDGWKQFNLNCARCHGEDVQGTTIAPHLIVSLKPDGPINTKESFVQTVCAGRPAKGMPSWCALGMEMPTIEAIYAYVKGRSDAKLHPGRPARRSGG